MRFLLILSLLTTIAFASVDTFAKEMAYETNYEQALSRAKQEKKDIMFVLVTNYCPFCRKFEKRALMSEEVDKMVKAKYIPLIINRERHNFPKHFESQRIPITYFISYKDDTKFTQTLGYKSKKDFIEYLKNMH